MLTIFSALLQSLQSAFSKSSVSKIADAVVYMVLIIFALNSFYVVMTYARETIQTMVDFILALLPILLALIATGGGVVSVSFSSDYHLLNEYEWAFDELYRSTTFITCNDIKYCKYDGDQYKVTKLSKLLQNVSVRIIGIFLTIFRRIICTRNSDSCC